jgi:hypothetical protein
MDQLRPSSRPGGNPTRRGPTRRPAELGLKTPPPKSDGKSENRAIDLLRDVKSWGFAAGIGH